MCFSECSVVFPSPLSRVSSPLHMQCKALFLPGLSNTKQLGDRAANARRALLWHLRWARTNLAVDLCAFLVKTWRLSFP